MKTYENSQVADPWTPPTEWESSVFSYALYIPTWRRSLYHRSQTIHLTLSLGGGSSQPQNTESLFHVKTPLLSQWPDKYPYVQSLYHNTCQTSQSNSPGFFFFFERKDDSGGKAIICCERIFLKPLSVVNESSIKKSFRGKIKTLSFLLLSKCPSIIYLSDFFLFFFQTLIYSPKKGG